MTWYKAATDVTNIHSGHLVSGIIWPKSLMDQRTQRSM